MSAAAVDKSVLEKLQTFLNDSGYKDLMRNSAKFNVNIRKDRIIRQPYIDGQTGVAQRHCNLFVSDKERMPGIMQGQVYTYPARRWKTYRRSYLAPMMEASRAIEPEELTIQTVENPAASMNNMIAVEEPAAIEKPKIPQEVWPYFEENTYDDDMEDDFDTDEDFDDETYHRAVKGGSKRRAPVRKTRQQTKPKRKPARPPTKLIKNIKKDEADPDNKPYACEWRPPMQRPPMQHPAMEHHHMRPMPSMAGGPMPMEGPHHDMPPVKKTVPPSTYCDFCLGDAVVNKKTGHSEHLVSCADCGRSGHPSCLQFTDNMLKSVVKYRWQCIECKTCTLCGTSENDDQLLFCDDCDRGYHLYCLSPPLSEPPEGEWSCYLCIREFHHK